MKGKGWEVTRLRAAFVYLAENMNGGIFNTAGRDAPRLKDEGFQAISGSK